MLKLLLIALLVSIHILDSTCWSVTLFDREGFDFGGSTIALTGKESECIDIPDYFKPLSLSTNEFCLRSYSEKGCQGETMAFFPGSYYHHLLKRYKTAIVSLRSCRAAF